MNAVYEDMSQINEILTLKDPTLLIEGVALFYRGIPLVNSGLACEPYLNGLVRLANLNDMFEKTSPSEESIIDFLWVKPKDTKGIMDLSADFTEEADDEYMRKVLEKETYMKYETETNVTEGDVKATEEEAKASASKPKQPPKVIKKADQELAKVINEIELRLRHDEPPSVRERRKVRAQNLGLVRKLITLVSGKGTSGSLVIGGVFHILDDDNTGEFDPYFIERMKNAL